jgi:hypothetical protein
MGLFRRRKRFYFLHIPKTAGSSLGAALRSHYPPHEILNCTLNQLFQMPLSEVRKRRAYMEHWGTGLFSLLDQPISTLTVLRDPFERTVSGIRFARRQHLPSEQPEIRDVFAGGDWNEIVNHPVASRLIENTQCLHLGTQLDFRPFLASPPEGIARSPEAIPYLEYHWFRQMQAGKIQMDQVLKAAKSRLDQMEMVGIFEQLEDTVQMACRFLGLRPPQSLPRERVSPEKDRDQHTKYRDSAGIPPEAIRRIDELTAFDRELYEYARSRFQRQLAESRRSFWPLSLWSTQRREKAS